MPHIKKRSYGICPVATGAAGTPRFLVVRAYKSWDFPKGGAELGETPLAAASREFQEETGLSAFSLDWDPVFRETKLYAGGKLATYFLARVTQQHISLPVNAEFGRPEHDEYCWATAANARSLLPPRLLAILDWAEAIVLPTARSDNAAS
jgi:8-oxo-dGTP pyrophosphatase MutT (NUDIX family)